MKTRLKPQLMLMAFIIPFIALCRTVGIVNIRFMVVPIVILIGFSFISIHGERIVITQWDTFWCLSIVMMLLHSSSTYSSLLLFMSFIGFLLLYIFRYDVRLFKYVFSALLIFAVINFVVNIIALIDYHSYMGIVQKLGASRELMKFGYLYGLGKDTGRNAYFCIAGASVPISYLLMNDKNKKTQNIICVVLVVLFSAIVLSTGKFGHTVFFAASIIITVAIKEPNLLKKIQKVFIVILVACVAFPILSKYVPEVNNLVTRTMEKISQDNFSSGRFELWAKAIDVFWEKPIFGIGYGSFSIDSASILGGVEVVGIHNDYIQWLCEQGIIGFLINVLALMSTYIYSIKTLQVIKRLREVESLSLCACIWSVFFQTFMILYSLSGIPHFSFEINIIYCIACAAPFAVVKQLHQSGKDVRVDMLLRF